MQETIARLCLGSAAGHFPGASNRVGAWLSLLVILLGALCYVIGQLAFEASATGYVWLSFNLGGAALYHVYVRYLISLLNVSTMDMVLYNNALSVPILLALALAFDRCATSPHRARAMRQSPRSYLVASL